jgi:hypothetical protein
MLRAQEAIVRGQEKILAGQAMILTRQKALLAVLEDAIAAHESTTQRIAVLRSGGRPVTERRRQRREAPS